MTITLQNPNSSDLIPIPEELQDLFCDLDQNFNEVFEPYLDAPLSLVRDRLLEDSHSDSASRFLKKKLGIDLSNGSINKDIAHQWLRASNFVASKSKLQSWPVSQESIVHRVLNRLVEKFHIPFQPEIAINISEESPASTYRMWHVRYKEIAETTQNYGELTKHIRGYSPEHDTAQIILPLSWYQRVNEMWQRLEKGEERDYLEAAIAWVLAHELGHLLRYQQTVIDVQKRCASKPSFQPFRTCVTQARSPEQNRNNELMYDKIGLFMLFAADYKVDVKKLIEKTREISRRHSPDVESNTHPSWPDRITHLEKVARSIKEE